MEKLECRQNNPNGSKLFQIFFEAILNQLHQQIFFVQEFRHVGRENSTNAALLPENRGKNRYTNILACKRLVVVAARQQ